MIHGGTVPWRTLSQWRAKAFLTAGGLFLASPAAKGLILVTGGPLPELVVALFVFTGLLAALGGLLGFYPELTDQIPYHALAGVVTTVLAAGVTVGVFGWLMATRVLGAMSYPASPGSPPELAFVSLVVAMAVGFAVVGTACLRVSVPSRSVGALLLALAVPWVVIFGAGAVYGSNFPAWLSLSTYGAIPVGLLATGHVLRKHVSVVERGTSAPDVTAD